MRRRASQPWLTRHGQGDSLVVAARAVSVGVEPMRVARANGDGTWQGQGRRRACVAGHRVAFATATEWVARLGDAKRAGSLEAELRRLGRVPLLVVDEVGYIPFDPEAANLMFSLVSARYERASMIVTSNKPFSAWGEIFGDEVVAAAMIDRLVHHAEILALKGDSYRLRDKDLGAPPAGD